MFHSCTSSAPFLVLNIFNKTLQSKELKNIHSSETTMFSYSLLAIIGNKCDWRVNVNYLMDYCKKIDRFMMDTKIGSATFYTGSLKSTD